MGNYPKLLEAKSGEHFPYSEELDEEGYFYRISVVWRKRDGELIIAPDGVSLSFDDGDSIHSNIIPRGLFGEVLKLTEEQLEKIILALVEGRPFSKKEMDDLYEYWTKM